MASRKINSSVPLTDQDMEALEEIFEQVMVEDMRVIEERAAHYSVAPLEPWEEKGWIVNSSPLGMEPRFNDTLTLK
ncbi:MAG TPA: hypothetical protein V6D35_23700 [Candidatus Sericytochromatia bacterium]|jgi:hypothetical protein